MDRDVTAVTVGKSVNETSYMLQVVQGMNVCARSARGCAKSASFRVAEGDLPLVVTVISVPGRDEGTVSVGQAVKFVGTVSLHNGFSFCPRPTVGTLDPVEVKHRGCSAVRSEVRSQNSDDNVADTCHTDSVTHMPAPPLPVLKNPHAVGISVTFKQHVTHPVRTGVGFCTTPSTIRNTTLAITSRLPAFGPFCATAHAAAWHYPR